MQAKTSNPRKKMATSYPLRVQAIRSRGQTPPALCEFSAGLGGGHRSGTGGEVQWELLDRRELHLLRLNPASAKTQGPSWQVGAGTHHKASFSG